MTSTISTPRALGAAVAALALIGCPTPADPHLLYEEDFERLCEGAPCGWAQVSGADGTALYVETLPGDHGLQLVGGDVTVRGIPDDDAVSAFSAQLAVRAVARCDVGGHLGVRTTFELRDGRSATFEATVFPDVTWSEVLQDQTLAIVDPVPSPWEIARVLGVSVRKNGPGACEIDYLAVRSVRAF